MSLDDLVMGFTGQKALEWKSCVIKMDIKKIAEGKFLLVIKSLRIREEFSDIGEAMRVGLGYILGYILG